MALIRRIGRRSLLSILAGSTLACGRRFAPLRPVEAPVFRVSSLPPISLPRDHFPHSYLTEWWYFTGHLFHENAQPFGFEFVIFQGLRGDYPRSYAAHFAITDFERQSFAYGQRTSAYHGASIADGLDLCVGGWKLRNADRGFVLSGTMDGYSLRLFLIPTKPPVLHNTTGKLDFRPFGWSYYYSVPRLEAFGHLSRGSHQLEVSGSAWMDHQWGNFISLGAGGWDWFALQLEDGRDITASIVRDARRQIVLRYGTLIYASGLSTHLDDSDFLIVVHDTWLSPHNGGQYPSAWGLSIPGEGVDLRIIPVIRDQELDVRSSTGNFYWEGAVRVLAGSELVGRGYVELTGYAPGGFMKLPSSTRSALNLCG